MNAHDLLPAARLRGARRSAVELVAVVEHSTLTASDNAVLKAVILNA